MKNVITTTIITLVSTFILAFIAGDYYGQENVDPDTLTANESVEFWTKQFLAGGDLPGSFSDYVSRHMYTADPIVTLGALKKIEEATKNPKTLYQRDLGEETWFASEVWAIRQDMISKIREMYGAEEDFGCDPKPKESYENQSPAYSYDYESQGYSYDYEYRSPAYSYSYDYVPVWDLAWDPNFL